jgi:hypothetical protein
MHEAYLSSRRERPMDQGMTIKCACCSHQNAPWRKHCGGCGSGLPGGCRNCGAVNEITDRFCGGCSQPLRRPGWKLVPKKAHDSTVPIDVVKDIIAEFPAQ